MCAASIVQDGGHDPKGPCAGLVGTPAAAVGASLLRPRAAAEPPAVEVVVRQQNLPLVMDLRGKSGVDLITQQQTLQWRRSVQLSNFVLVITDLFGEFLVNECSHES